MSDSYDSYTSRDFLTSHMFILVHHQLLHLPAWHMGFQRSGLMQVLCASIECLGTIPTRFHIVEMFEDHDVDY